MYEDFCQIEAHSGEYLIISVDGRWVFEIIFVIYVFRLRLLLCRFSTFLYDYRIIASLPFFSDEMVFIVLVLCLVESICRWSADYASFSKGCVLCSSLAVNDLHFGHVICAKFIFGLHDCLESTRKCIFLMRSAFYVRFLHFLLVVLILTQYFS